MKDPTQVAAEIGAEYYLRTRLDPRPGETYYLHLKDLRRALDEVATTAPVRLLDFGCGSSPYRSLFPNAKYLRADYVPSADLDYVVHEDQTVEAPSESFDMVLSTQVLEHVRDTATYLSECTRLLKPGGKLVLSTHGFFEEHGCPYDFRRWTVEGLKYDLRASGLSVESVRKLTTGGRALSFLLHLHSATLTGRQRRTVLGMIQWLFLSENRPTLRLFDRWSDRRFANLSVVDGDDPGNTLYIGLFAVATKPSITK